MMTVAIHPVWKFLGTDDSVDVCDCCGRKNLKSTVALESYATGEVVHYGTSCAASALKWAVKEVKSATKSADEARTAAERAAREAAADAAFAKWKAWLNAQNTGHTEIFQQIQALGGGTVARAKYKAECGE